MCGIVAYVGSADGVIKALDMVEKMEYRGYDSFGVLYARENTYIIKGVGSINDQVDTTHGISYKGKIRSIISADLICSFKSCKDTNVVLLGHTRWATNGKVCKENAHPHTVGNLHIVHNGIFKIDTSWFVDTESDTLRFLKTLNYLIDLNPNRDIEEIITISLRYMLETSLSIGDNVALIYHDKCPGKIFVVVTGNRSLYRLQNDEGTFLCSDTDALCDVGRTCQSYSCKSGKNFLIDVEDNGPRLHMDKCIVIQPSVCKTKYELPYDFTMLNEIEEQISLVKNVDTALGNWGCGCGTAIIGCGSSYNAGMFAKCYSEFKINVEYASEHIEVKEDHLYEYPIFVTQSGSTQDTIKSMRAYCNRNNKTIVTNNPQLFPKKRNNIDPYICGLECSPEFAVAATKTFVLSCLKLIQGLNQEEVFNKSDLRVIANRMQYVWNRQEIIRVIANKFKGINHILVLGTGPNYAIALEGALKIKEVAQIHAEGLPAAEVKHGPIALVDEKTLAIFVVNYPYANSIIENHNQIKSSGGKTIVIADNSLHNKFLGCDEYIGHEEGIYWNYDNEISYQISQSLASNMALQLLSYYLAVTKNLNPDRPRHLAKCVTV